MIHPSLIVGKAGDVLRDRWVYLRDTVRFDLPIALPILCVPIYTVIYICALKFPTAKSGKLSMIASRRKSAMEDRMANGGLNFSI